MTASIARRTVSVRTLCEFTAKAGDLDRRFTPSSTALEGIAGHAVVAARRGPQHETEVVVTGEFDGLQVRGRADGFDAARARVEEVKTHRGDVEAIPANRSALHWAQVETYGALICSQRGLAEIELALVYFDVSTQDETVLTVRHQAGDLQTRFEQRCRAYAEWAEQDAQHRLSRDEALAALPFPHDGFRPGQRELSEAVYRATVGSRCLVAQAPTGIGKTMGTLFPMLKACPGQRLDKVWFLTAKTSGRSLALDAVARLREALPALPLRVLELVARDRACEHPDKACHGESCPLAQGFYDRLPAARAAAVALAVQDKAAVREVALAHQVCPYHLTQELVRWADVAIGDFNHWFDMHAVLHGLSVAEEWRVGLLVDEAHNLIERARSMYSASLQRADLTRLLPLSPAGVRPSLRRLDRCWQALEDAQDLAYEVHPQVRPDMAAALQQASSALTDHLAEQPLPDAALLHFSFDLLHFNRLLDAFDDHSLFDVMLGAGDRADPGPGPGSTLCLRNVVPAPFLKARFAACHSATLFSATMSPLHYHLDLLGLPADTAHIDVASPFDAMQLRVEVAGDISTRWRHRDDSLAPIVDRMARRIESDPGHYLAFFSSFDYLQQVAGLLRQRHPAIATWAQSRAMSEADRDAFLARFTPHGCGIGFAVLGGAFAEGIDLPGRRLIGAFIATLGLPQINPVNEQIRSRMQQLFGAGHDYAYLYPGLQKVVQAAGRVIRGPDDRGVVVLIDDRYRRPEVQRLLPAWWNVAGRDAVKRSEPVVARLRSSSTTTATAPTLPDVRASISTAPT
jgi:DNA excision repair protein ERCC-2